MLIFLLVATALFIVGLSALPAILIKRANRRDAEEAVIEFRDQLEPVHELTFEERWDAADDEFMKKWSSFCSRDLATENEQLIQRFAVEAEEVIQRHVDNVTWTYQHMAAYFLHVDTTVEVTASWLVMKADGDFDEIRKHSEDNTDADHTIIWTEKMENELEELLKEGAKEEVKA